MINKKVHLFIQNFIMQTKFQSKTLSVLKQKNLEDVQQSWKKVFKQLDKNKFCL